MVYLLSAWNLDGGQGFVTIASAWGAAIFTAAVMWIGIHLTLRSSREQLHSAQLANLAEWLLSEYMDRKLSRPLLLIDANGESRLVRGMKEARHVMRRRFWRQGGVRNEGELAQLRSACAEEKTFAYEVSLALERLGAMVLSGAIPPSLVFPMVGQNVLEDWEFCKGLVQGLTQDTGLYWLSTLGNEQPIAVPRVHGEWLAMAATVYSAANWARREVPWPGLPIRKQGSSGPAPEKVVSDARKRERAIRATLSGLIPRAVKKDIRRVLGDWWWPPQGRKRWSPGMLALNLDWSWGRGPDHPNRVRVVLSFDRS